MIRKNHCNVKSRASNDLVKKKLKEPINCMIKDMELYEECLKDVHKVKEKVRKTIEDVLFAHFIFWGRDYLMFTEPGWFFSKLDIATGRFALEIMKICSDIGQWHNIEFEAVKSTSKYEELIQFAKNNSIIIQATSMKNYSKIAQLVRSSVLPGIETEIIPVSYLDGPDASVIRYSSYKYPVFYISILPNPLVS